MNASKSQCMVGKVALVTGAASGIGRATAQRLAEEGARVALADLNQPELTKVADAICASGGHAIALRLDVTSEADWQAAMTRILSDWGRLDICVNCAGISFAKPISELSLADWRRVMATNLDGVFLGTRQAMSAMKEHGGGCIINIASAAGIKPVSGNAAYGTSKAAIRFFTRVAALEGAPHHVRVNSISPGAVATRCGNPRRCGPSRSQKPVGRMRPCRRWFGIGASPSRRKSQRWCFSSPATVPGT